MFDKTEYGVLPHAGGTKEETSTKCTAKKKCRGFGIERGGNGGKRAAEKSEKISKGKDIGDSDVSGDGDQSYRESASACIGNSAVVGTNKETTQHRSKAPADLRCWRAQKKSAIRGMKMVQEVEITTLDLRYESYRMRNSAQEGRLLSAIAQRGIEEPLEGVAKASCNILLNGFKRYRCARKLHILMVPYMSIGEDEALGIMGLLRVSNNKSLSILEQARFIDDLKNHHGLNVTAIASELGRSKSWVSMRLGLIGEMSEAVREKIFSGSFPVYPYMYTLRQFMRMNSVSKKDVEEFVVALSGKNLSVREIERLARGYFQGPASYREEIRKGNVSLPLANLSKVPENNDGCNAFERVFLKDLIIVQKYMQRVMGKSLDHRLKSRSFHAQANLLSDGIISKTSTFLETMRGLHDRSGKA